MESPDLNTLLEFSNTSMETALLHTEAAPCDILEDSGVEILSSSRYVPYNPSRNENIVYGEFIILGYNGKLPEGDRGRRRSKIGLHKRQTANGITKTRQYKVPNFAYNISPPLSNDDNNTYSIKFQMKDYAVVAEYKKDEATDIFQIGRSSESPIDFVVLDTIPGNKVVDRHTVKTPQTISRFACRVLASRDVNHPAVEIFAAGFDSSKKIFLGNNATIWKKWSLDDACIHGLTTNGVLIMKPIGVFCDSFEKASNQQYSTLYTNKRKSPLMPGTWREVSVDGNIFGRREPRSAIVEGIPVPTEDNLLTDGTLVDLCGATLLWRSSDGLKRSPTADYLQSTLSHLADFNFLPSNILDMVLPKKTKSDRKNSTKTTHRLFACINCGHVQQTQADDIMNENNINDYCPYCRTTSQLVQLCLGMEAGFYVDFGPPLHSFVPCGHMVTEETAKYWANVPIPCVKSGFYSACPFCATPLDGSTGYIKLIFVS